MPKTYKPEERLQVATCQMLHALAPASILYFHPAQEAIRSKATWGFQIEMGFVKGVSDWIIMGKIDDQSVLAAIELKAGKNKQTDYQKEFQQWCERAGIPYWPDIRNVHDFATILISLDVFKITNVVEWMKYKLPLLAAQLNMPDDQIR